MTAYLVRRLVHSVFVIVGLMVVVFVVTRMLGDAARLMLPIEAPEAQYLALRQKLGLDQPLYVQLLQYMLQQARGDFGMSLWQGVPATQLVLSRFPATLYLAVSAITFSFLIALPIGTISAIKPRSGIDRLTTVLSFVGISMPTFWLALILITLLAVNLGWFKTSGYGGPEYLVLPVLSLCSVHIGRIAQVVRSSMLDEMGKQYVVTARSKGVVERRVVLHHALRNAALPIITLTADELAGLVNGSVIIEVIFGWPGIGLLAMEAIERRDFPVIQADVFVVAASVVLLNLFVDLSYAYLDPRVRFG